MQNVHLTTKSFLLRVAQFNVIMKYNSYSISLVEIFLPMNGLIFRSIEYTYLLYIEQRKSTSSNQVISFVNKTKFRSLKRFSIVF